MSLLRRPPVTPQQVGACKSSISILRTPYTTLFLGGSLALCSCKSCSAYAAPLLSYLKVSVCFLCKIHHYRSLLPTMGLSHSLVLRLLLLIFFEFGYARPHTPSHEHIHGNLLTRNHVDSLVCRNPVSYVLSCEDLAGVMLPVRLMIFQMADVFEQPFRLFGQDSTGRRCSRL